MRVGVIGLGNMGRNHARIWQKMPEAELVAVADTDEEQLESWSMDGPATYDSAKTMMMAEKLDIVSVAVPTNLHADVGIMAMEHGAHVIVEKPIAPTIVDAYALINAARRLDRQLTVGHIERFNPVFSAMKSMLPNIGVIHQLTATRHGPLPSRDMGVGVTVDLATHDIDVMMALVGRPPDDVAGFTRIRTTGGQRDDQLVGLMGWTDGPIGLLDVNWLVPAKKRELTIVGSLGALYADYQQQTLKLITGKEVHNIYIQPREPLQVELELVLHHVLYRRGSALDPEQALETLKVALTMNGERR